MNQKNFCTLFFFHPTSQKENTNITNLTTLLCTKATWALLHTGRPMMLCNITAILDELISQGRRFSFPR